jgi:hypothetical protein
MKKLIYVLVFVSLILFPLSTAHAALTKATAAVDAWAEVTAGTLREGATVDTSPNYQTTLFIDVCLSEATAETAGATILVQVSSNTTGDADWSTLTSFGGPTGTAAKRDISGDEAAGQTVLSTTDPVTGNLNHHGKMLFIENTATAANSEIVYSVSDSGDAGDTITVQDGLTNAQAAADGDIWSIDGTASAVAQYVVNIPDTAYRVRVIYDDILATGADIFTRARISKITAI